MKNRTTQKTCDCPMECTTISYSFRVVSTKFEDKEMCGETSENSVMNDFNLVGHKFPHQFIRKLIHLKNNSVSSNEVEYCKRNLKYRAEVIFMLATDSMSVTIMSSRLSFFDKMSAFGKYRQNVPSHCHCYLGCIGRWDSGSVYRNQHPQHDGGGVLGSQISGN